MDTESRMITTVPKGLEETIVVTGTVYRPVQSLLHNQET